VGRGSTTPCPLILHLLATGNLGRRAGADNGDVGGIRGTTTDEDDDED
jgi:hypothetical protein